MLQYFADEGIEVLVRQKEESLGLSEEHEGDIFLDADAPTGMPLADYMGDAVLEINLLPNLAGNFTGVGADNGSRLAAGGLNNPVVDRLPDCRAVHVYHMDALGSQRLPLQSHF